MFEQSKKIDVTTLLQAMESEDSHVIENLRTTINNDVELKKQLSIEIGGLFLSCVAMSEVFGLKVEEIMNEASCEEIANSFGIEACDEDCCDDEDCDDENGCCGTC